MTNPEDWLERHAYGYFELGASERQAIAHFALLWSFFESRLLNSHATVSAIVAKVEKWRLVGVLKAEPFEIDLSYFKQRYYAHGRFTPHFDGLNFRRNDRRGLVESVLNGQRQGAADVVAALLLIVYRLRNNLFHGEKWSYGIREQEPNFVHANRVLMKIMELA